MKRFLLPIFLLQIVFTHSAAALPEGNPGGSGREPRSLADLSQPPTDLQRFARIQRLTCVAVAGGIVPAELYGAAVEERRDPSLLDRCVRLENDVAQLRGEVKTTTQIARGAMKLATALATNMMGAASLEPDKTWGPEQDAELVTQVARRTEAVKAGTVPSLLALQQQQNSELSRQLKELKTAQAVEIAVLREKIVTSVSALEAALK